MKVLEMLAGPTDRLALVLFFDRHVERVEEKANRIASDILSQLHSLLGLVYEVSLEAVERFESDRDALRFGRLAHFPQRVDRPLPFLLALVFRGIARAEELGVERA